MLLFEQINEDQLREQWLHTPMTQSLKEFKKQYGPKKAPQKISKEKQQEALNYAYQFIKPTKPLEGEVK